MSREEIALELTKTVLANITYSSLEEAKTLPYKIFNETYDNLYSDNANVNISIDSLDK